jgi:hypothetical protein
VHRTGRQPNELTDAPTQHIVGAGKGRHVSPSMAPFLLLSPYGDFPQRITITLHALSSIQWDALPFIARRCLPVDQLHRSSVAPASVRFTGERTMTRRMIITTRKGQDWSGAASASIDRRKAARLCKKVHVSAEWDTSSRSPTTWNR